MQEKSDDVDTGYLGKTTAKVHKRLKPACLYDENRTYREKKLKIGTLNGTEFMVKLKLLS